MAKDPVKIPGSELERGLVRALGDLFGPAISELGDSLGEWVRQKRGKRLTRTVELAAKISAERDDQPKPPPAKFLIPYLEAASLEEDESDQLNQMWAELLADAGYRYSSTHPVFVDVLKRLDQLSADVFESIAERPTVRRGALSQLEDCDIDLRHSNVVETVQQLYNFDPDSWASKILEYYSRFGVAIWRLTVGDAERGLLVGEDYFDFVYREDRGESDLGLSALEALGLVRSHTFRAKVNTFMAEGEIVWITLFGAEFYFATHDRNSRLPPMERPPKPSGYADDR